MENREEGFTEIGARIEPPPIPKHVCEYTRILDKERGVSACECGAIHMAAGFIKPGEDIELRRVNNTPGAVFEAEGEL